MQDTPVGPTVDDIVVEEVDGGLLVLHPRTKRALVLNDTATAIWQLCDGTLTENEIVATLAEAYGETPAAIEAQVRGTLTDLRDGGFLRPRPA